MAVGAAISILLWLLLAACGPQEVKKLPDQVTVQLKWVHQAQFAFGSPTPAAASQRRIWKRYLNRSSPPGPGASALVWQSPGTWWS